MDFITKTKIINKAHHFISNQDKKIFITKILSLFNKLNKNSSDDDGDSAILEMSIDFCFSSNTEKLNFLKSLLQVCKNSQLRKILTKKIYAVEKEIQKESEKEYYISEQKNIKQTNSKNNDLETLLSTRKKELALFNLNRKLDHSYFPTVEPFVNTKKFDKLSDSEILEMFAADKFYNLSKTQIHALLQSVANRYLASHGVSPCTVSLEDLTLNSNSICFGEYCPNIGAININNKLLDNLENCQNVRDQYLPYKLLETTIHEARHRVQFSKLGNNNLNAKEQYISESLYHNQDLLTFSQYLAEPDELDARNAALEFFKNAALTGVKNSDSLIDYYNYKLNKERNDKKDDIPGYAKEYFKEIYLSSPIITNSKTTINPELFFDIIHGKVNTVMKEPHL